MAMLQGMTNNVGWGGDTIPQFPIRIGDTKYRIYCSSNQVMSNFLLHNNNIFLAYSVGWENINF